MLKSNFKKTILSLALSSAVSGMASSNDDLLLWSDSSLSLLTGAGFEVTGNKMSTLTAEHASGWAFGDLFMFVEAIDFHDNPYDSATWYGEFSPRFSLNKMGLIDLGDAGFVKDLSIATNFERGEGGYKAMLIGAGTSLNVPGFKFVDMNIYARKDTSQGAGFDDVQLTLVWAKEIKVGEQAFVFDGFVDYVVGWGPQASNLHIVPQIKWDMGKALGWSAGKLYFGTEIDIWFNKFGIGHSDTLKTNQIGFNALIKAHF